MLVEEAYRHVSNSFVGDQGRFYESGQRLSLGKGCIQRRAVFALFDEESSRYRTAEGVVYVLTHECDIDEENARLFNTDLLVCPLLPLQDVVGQLTQVLNDDQLASFLTNLAARNISRLIYIPPIGEVLEFGGVMYLNLLTNAPVAHVKEHSERVCALSAFGIRDVEYVLENHLLRPKAERVALMPEEGT